jgi:glycosyltransferase involved in cell wall biosynthesis
MPTISVVMPTYNRRESLLEVISPLLADEATLELIVVVDGARDGSLELLQEVSSRERRLKPIFVENGGTPRAKQIGVDHAVGDLILLVDDDVVAAPELVTGHRRHHAEREGIVVVGYMPVARSQGVRRHAATELYARTYERSCERYERDPTEILRALWGGNVSISRVDCLRVPTYIEGFSDRARYHEDREWGIRCMKAGLIGVFDRSLLAQHLHTKTLEASLRDARSEGAGRASLHQLHADVLGPLDTGAFERNLPGVARWLVRGSTRPKVHTALLRIAVPAARFAALLRLSGIEKRLTQLLRRIEIQWGALETKVATSNHCATSTRTS